MPRPNVHPELARYGTCTLDRDGCVTCGDLAVPVRVLRVADGQALCEDRLGNQAIVALDFVPDTTPGDVLLVHLGVALTKIGADDTLR
jgi:hydrogenase expression/formation protein HypC